MNKLIVNGVLFVGGIALMAYCKWKAGRILVDMVENKINLQKAKEAAHNNPIYIEFNED